MSTRILNAQGILSSDVPTGNLLWVDRVNGVDALAARGRMTIPFRTLTAAKNAALSGDTIMVLPGTYNEDNLFKNGVNWHFLEGTKIVGQVADNDLFRVEFAPEENPLPFRVSGYGEFVASAGNVGTDGGGQVLKVDDAEADVSFTARSLAGPRWALRVLDCSRVRVEAGSLSSGSEENAGGAPLDVRGGQVMLDIREIKCETIAAYIDGGDVSVKAQRILAPAAVYVVSGTARIEANEVCGGNYPAVNVFSGDVLIRAHRISGSTGVYVQDGTVQIEANEICGESTSAMSVVAGNILVRAQKISAPLSWGVQCYMSAKLAIEAFEISSLGDTITFDAPDGVLTIRNARIISQTDSPVRIDNGSSGSPPKCRLWNCHFRCDPASSAVVAPSSTPATVGLYGQCVGNTDVDSGSITVEGTPLTIADLD